jgi:hypothetical protein
MKCKKWNIIDIIDFCEDRISLIEADKLNSHIDFCSVCQLRFIAVVDWLCNEDLSGFLKKEYSSIFKIVTAIVLPNLM